MARPRRLAWSAARGAAAVLNHAAFGAAFRLQVAEGRMAARREAARRAGAHRGE